MLWASPPAAGADAEGRFDVDSVLVTECLLSFVGTLAGLKLSSDIAACIQRPEAFQSLSALRGYERSYRSRTAPQRRGGSAYVSRREEIVQNSTAPLIKWQPINWAAPNLFCALFCALF